MKTKSWIIHLLLMLVILISMFLSYVVIFNPFAGQTTSSTKKTTATTGLTTNGSQVTLSNVVWPTSVIENATKGQNLITSINVSPVNVVKTRVGKWRLKTIKVKTYSHKAYNALLKQAGYLVLNYGDHVPVLTAESLFANQLNKYKSARINHVMLSTGANAEVLLLNDSKHKVYRITLSNANTRTTLMKKLASYTITKSPVEFYEMHGRYNIIYTKALTLSKSSYLLRTNKVGSYLTTLLGSSVTSGKEQRNMTMYSDGANQRVTVNNKTHQVTYTNYTKSKASTTFLNNLQASFTLLSKTNSDLDDVRFFAYDAKAQAVVYRTYIGEWPILGDNAIGMYTYRHTRNMTTLSFSLRALSVPVPVSKKHGTVTLPKTKTILKKLQQAGYNLNDIYGVRVGYALKANNSSSQVIDMIPSYYLFYHGKWQQYQTLMQAKQ